jgi:hypothetical protein
MDKFTILCRCVVSLYQLKAWSPGPHFVGLQIDLHGEKRNTVCEWQFSNCKRNVARRGMWSSFGCPDYKFPPSFVLFVVPTSRQVLAHIILFLSLKTPDPSISVLRTMSITIYK